MFVCCKTLFIHSREGENEREGGKRVGKGAEGEGKVGSPPNVGLNPRTPGSRPEP